MTQELARDSGIDQQLAEKIKTETVAPIPESLEESDLTDLENVDEETAVKLFNSGYKTTEHLAAANHMTIASRSGIDKQRAGIIKEEVRNGN